MSHRREFVSLLVLCGLIALVGCSPTESEPPVPTSIGETSPLHTNNSQQIPLDTLINDTPTSIASPTAITNPTNAVQSPASAAPGTLIPQFSANPATADPGSAVTLTWRATGNSATLRMLRADNVVLNTWEGLAQQGSITITVPDSARERVSFMLTTDTGGVTESASVSVALGCADSWFFAHAPEVCAASAALTWQGVAQPFEHGLMVWLPPSAAFPTPVIYVLFEDGTMAAVGNTWQNGMPIDDPAITAPAGFFEPTRSFGVVWRDAQMRPRLGWATGAEVQYQARYQCDSTPRDQTCYLQGPSSLLVIEPMTAGWHVWWGESVR